MSTDMLPDLIHFSSWTTRVSLELPVGFEEMKDDPDLRVVLYADEREEEELQGARVVVKTVAVAASQEDAWRKVASVHLAAAGSRLEHHEERLIDGHPAAVILYWQDNRKLDSQLLRHETVIQAGDVLFTISAACPTTEAGTYLAAFEHASRTARLLLPEVNVRPSEPPLSSFTHRGALLSLLVPEQWEVEELSPTRLRLRPPGQSSAQPDTWFEVERVRPEGYGDEWYEATFRAAVEPQALGWTDRQVTRSERFDNSSHGDVLFVNAQGRTPSGEERSALVAHILVFRLAHVRVEAHTPRSSEAEHLPVFEEILRSIRVLFT